MTHQKYTFTLEVRDQPGVLVRIAQVFSRRGCNIQSLQVHPKSSGTWSIMGINATGIPRPDQIQYQLEKLVDVNNVVVHQHTAEG